MVQRPGLDRERHLWAQGQSRVAGVDEVGLGCLAGPIVAAAVVVPLDCQPIDGVRDSKQLSARQRHHLVAAIQQQAIAIGVGMASVLEIDRFNVLNASYLAMGRALLRVQPYDHALIDGRAIPSGQVPGSYTTIIDGDASSYAIACASIVAKVRRDRLMGRLARRFPGYGWETNAGYGTKAHIAALETLGITPWHRCRYGPVKRVLQGRMAMRP